MDNETDTTTAPRRLQRRSSERMVAGIAGGLGDYTGVDPVFFRIGFIVLTLAGGSGALLYALGWLLIPEENHPTPVGLTLFERVRGHRWLGVALVAIFSVLFLNWFRLGTPDWNVFLAVALVAIGFVLLRDEPPRQSRPLTGASTTAPAPTAEALVDAPSRRPKRPRSPLGFMTLGAAFVAVAFASILAEANVADLDAGQFVALAVMTIGLGLIVGAWWGRARLLVLVATLLLPLMIVASMIDVPFKGSIGKNEYLQLRGEVAREEYEVLAGTLQLDFSKFRFSEKATELSITFGAGNVSIYVPPGVEVTLNGEVDLGYADVFGERFEGRNMTFGETYKREGLTKGELIINVNGGLGSFDTTWARWVDQETRYKERMKQREQRRERKGRTEVKKDGRRRDKK